MQVLALRTTETYPYGLLGGGGRAVSKREGFCVRFLLAFTKGLHSVLTFSTPFLYFFSTLYIGPGFPFFEAKDSLGASLNLGASLFRDSEEIRNSLSLL